MTMRSKLFRYLPIILTLFLAVLVIYLASIFLETETEQPQRKKVVQQVTIFTPPPPPPPPPEQEPEVQEPEDEAPVDEMDEAMPEEDVGEDAGNDLGLDADGVAGADGFGLLARKGGRGILGGGYGALVVQEINAMLVDDERLRSKEYTVLLKIWISENGDIERYKIEKKTGDEAVVAMIESVLARMGTVSEGPPLELPQPIRLRIKSRI
ncbi:MAG: energy transducer TonB [Gammaproteobacteria bacterium]|nr:energy transducer TonB [Gammaproteobacteria bacterium]